MPLSHVFKKLNFLRRANETAVCLNSSYFGFFAHAGFLKGLHEIGVRADHLSGSSAGALTAGVGAAGFAPNEIIATMLDPALRGLFLEWGAVLRLPGMLTNRRGCTGALSGKKILAFLKNRLGDRRIEECRAPSLSIAVMNLTEGRTEIVQSGPLAEYILASCAAPGLIRAREIDGRFYMDGGVADPAPMEQWLDNPRIGRIIVHLVDSGATPVGAAESPAPAGALSVDSARGSVMGTNNAGAKFSMLEAVKRSHDVISEELVRLKIALAKNHGKRIDVVRTRTPRPGPGRLHLGEGNVELGRRAALQLER